jgi:hypothetical protein
LLVTIRNVKLIFDSCRKIVQPFQAYRYTTKVLGTTNCSLKTGTVMIPPGW